MNNKQTTKVFVYGTLKKGFPNHHVLKNADFVGKATTTGGGFAMATNGFYPAVWRGAGPANVQGEVYEVSSLTLGRLDILEGHPGFYRREPVETTQGQVEMYLLTPSSKFWTKTKPVNGILTF